MSNVKRIWFLNWERNQTALFCAVGLSVSLALVLVYDLRIVDAWV